MKRIVFLLKRVFHFIFFAKLRRIKVWKIYVKNRHFYLIIKTIINDLKIFCVNFKSSGFRVIVFTRCEEKRFAKKRVKVSSVLEQTLQIDFLVTGVQLSGYIYNILNFYKMQ